MEKKKKIPDNLQVLSFTDVAETEIFHANKVNIKAADVLCASGHAMWAVWTFVYFDRISTNYDG